MIIGLSGTNSAGKETVANYLQGIGYTVASLPDLLKEEMTKRGITEKQTGIGEAIKKLELELGAGFLAREAIARFGDKKNLVILGITKSSEVNYLRTLEGFKLVFIDAPIEMRYMRAVKKRRDDEAKISYDEFMMKDMEEMSGAKTNGLEFCKKGADYLLINDETLEDLITKVDALIEKAAI